MIWSNLSLVLWQIGGRWLIAHDHTPQLRDEGKLAESECGP